jgi:glycosyltransferase involved in cell wall biosynthesis
MRIVYLWDADYPWDVRTEKVCAALTDAGHRVTIAARNRGWRGEVERLPEGTVRRMRPWRWTGRRMDGLLSFPAFFSPRWTGLLADAVREADAELVIVRDLPLCPAAIRVARRRGIPVVLDMAENYPAMLRQTWKAGRHRPWDVLVRNPALAAAVERWCLARVDRVITVVDESAARVARMGVPAERIDLVSNTPPRVRALPPAPPRTEAGPLTLAYVGLMEVPRGIRELLDAAALLRAGGIGVRLRLIGGGRDLELFRAHAAELGLDGDAVSFTGPLPHAEAMHAVARADVGVVPHHADEAWNTTIPNKLFDYMAAALPVIASDAAPVARILAETGAGLVFRSGDPRSLARAIGGMVDAEARRRMGCAGRDAVLARYHWEADAAVLLRAVEAAVRPGSSSPGDGEERHPDAGEAHGGAGARPTPSSAKTAPPAAPIRQKATK